MPSVMWESMVQSIEYLNGTQEEILLPDCLSGDIGIFQALGLKLKNQLSYVLQPTRFHNLHHLFSWFKGLWTHPIGSPGFSACQLQVLGLLHLHNHMNQFLYIFWFLFL